MLKNKLLKKDIINCLPYVNSLYKLGSLNSEQRNTIVDLFEQSKIKEIVQIVESVKNDTNKVIVRDLLNYLDAQ